MREGNEGKKEEAVLFTMNFGSENTLITRHERHLNQGTLTKGIALKHQLS